MHSYFLDSDDHSSPGKRNYRQKLSRVLQDIVLFGDVALLDLLFLLRLWSPARTHQGSVRPFDRLVGFQLNDIYSGHFVFDESPADDSAIGRDGEEIPVAVEVVLLPGYLPHWIGVLPDLKVSRLSYCSSLGREAHHMFLMIQTKITGYQSMDEPTRQVRLVVT